MKLAPIICLPVISLLVTSTAKGQHTEPLLLKVTYNFTYLYDKVNNTHPLETEVTLRVGKINSKFNNARLETPQPATKENKLNNPNISAKTVTVAGAPVASVISKEINKEIIYQAPGENHIVKIDNLGFQAYKIEIPFPQINWKVEQDTISLGGFTCQKATGMFGGRVYIAWFAPELPFKYGPWKLCGLPGLILEAADTANEVVFKFKELIKPKETEYIIYDAYRPVTIKEDAFDKAKKQFDKDPIAYSQAQLKGDSQISQITFIDASGKTLTGNAAKKAIKREQEKKITNPMEVSNN